MSLKTFWSLVMQEREMIDYVDKSNTPMFCFAKIISIVLVPLRCFLFFFIFLRAPETLLRFSAVKQEPRKEVNRVDRNANVDLVEIKEGALFEIF